jgi:hypothetical protein
MLQLHVIDFVSATIASVVAIFVLLLLVFIVVVADLGVV